MASLTGRPAIPPASFTRSTSIWILLTISGPTWLDDPVRGAATAMVRNSAVAAFRLWDSIVRNSTADQTSTRTARRRAPPERGNDIVQGMLFSAVQAPLDWVTPMEPTSFDGGSLQANRMAVIGIGRYFIAFGMASG